MPAARSSASSRRARARRGEGARLREEILAAATRLLAETGDEEAVSIRAVAEAVGVTPPSIYLHFADKTELIFAVCEEQFRQLDDEMAAAEAAVADPLEALRRRGQAYVRFGLRNAEAYRVLFMYKNHVPENVDDEYLYRSETFNHLVESVQRCLDAGALRPGDPLQISIGLWVLVHGVTSLLLAAPTFPWPNEPGELVDRLITDHLEGLLPPLDRPARLRISGCPHPGRPGCPDGPAGSRALASAGKIEATQGAGDDGRAGGDGGPGDGSVGRVLAPLLQLRTLTATIYLLVSMFVGLTWHVILAVGLLSGWAR